MRRILAPAAMRSPTTRDYGRRPVMNDDLRISPEARALLNALDKRVLPIQLSCRYPRVMNQIARLWRRPVHLDRYFARLVCNSALALHPRNETLALPASALFLNVAPFTDQNREGA